MDDKTIAAITKYESENIARKFKDGLSESSYNLLNKVMEDLYSKVIPSRRIYKREDNSLIIYNLLKGNYACSGRQYKEIFETLTKT